jgi:hypothetical protein
MVRAIMPHAQTREGVARGPTRAIMRAMRLHALPLLSLLAAAAACEPEPNAQFTVRESVGQLQVTHAEAGAELEVVDAKGVRVQAGTADALGSLMFRGLAPGKGYQVRTTKAPPERTRRLGVLTAEESAKAPEFYTSQKLAPGFNYITTRDGTTLSAYVFLPGAPEDGPYPTVVDYSGYAPSKPGEPVGDYDFLCNDYPVLCDAPNDPSALMAGLFGYASVSVNIRGTGCSGGAYDYFETMQLLDGYDVIETVAAQDWVMHHKVGMVGLSYPGITQLFVAAQRPPGLAAITPISVIGNSATTMFPAGILNDGFALAWVTNVLAKADPYGQGWERARVDAGDATCAENQLLHGQKVDNVEQARHVKFYDPALHDALNPTAFVDRIEVPVFLACAFQDEQTGPFFTTLLDRFTHADLARLIVYNGVHIDGFAPQVLAEMIAFLELFVAQRRPAVDPGTRALAPTLFENIFGSRMALPANRFVAFDTYEDALAAYRAEPPLRAIFESGGDTDDLGAPRGTFELDLASWPPPATHALRLYFQPDGSLAPAAPVAASGASSFLHDSDAGQRGILAPGGDVWAHLPDYDWRQPAPGSAAIFTSAPLDADQVMLGTGSVDLWLRSTAAEADLEVNLSEVRPDGKEMYVQSGWLRASYRGLAPGSTELWPVPTLEEKDWAPLVPGEWTQARVAIAGFGHVFRAGSRVRISVDTPGDSRADWRFALTPYDGEVTHTVGHSSAHPSSVALPLLEGVTAPSPLPPCPSLRGQPCRAYVPYTNTPGE